METFREIAEVRDCTVTIRLPESFEAQRVEVIVIPLVESPAQATAATRRTPSPRLAGTTIIGDLMEPAVPAEVWEALR